MPSINQQLLTSLLATAITCPDDKHNEVMALINQLTNQMHWSEIEAAKRTIEGITGVAGDD